MQVGDLIRWENSNDEYELGVVTEILASQRQAVVWFFVDCDFSIMTIGGLEVINKSRCCRQVDGVLVWRRAVCMERM